MGIFSPFTRPSFRRVRFFFLLLLLPLLCLFSCGKKTELFDYVSELREDVLLAETDGFSLRVYLGKKESPYSPDGIPRERIPRFEAYLSAPDGAANCRIRFDLDGTTYEGEMSYDNVNGEYYYFRSLDIGKRDSVLFHIAYGEREVDLTAKSVRTEKTLSPREILRKLESQESALIAQQTDKYGFKGEIYLRLLFEDAPYYYVGVVDREGRVYAFLYNAETGKLLAKRQT